MDFKMAPVTGLI